MRYFKTTENGILLRIDACDLNPCNGEEISAEEYRAILDEIKPPESHLTADQILAMIE